MSAAQEDALLVALMNPNARVPFRGTPGSAGLDLSSAEAAILLPGRSKHVSTGLAVRVPAGTYGRIAPKSGLAKKSLIDVFAGVVDADYRGTVMVQLFNHGTEPFEIHVGDRVAQLVLEKISTAEPWVVPFEALESTARGEGGSVPRTHQSHTLLPTSSENIGNPSFKS